VLITDEPDWTEQDFPADIPAAQAAIAAEGALFCGIADLTFGNTMTVYGGYAAASGGQMFDIYQFQLDPYNFFQTFSQFIAGQIVPEPVPEDDLNRMLFEAVNQHTITYRGSGEAIREYIHVEDAARLSVQVLAPEFANRHLILTGQEKLRIKDVMTMISEIMPWPVTLHFINANAVHHYEVTPYAFQPRIGRKLVLNEHVDLGQGLLDCLRDIHQSLHHAKDEDEATPSTSDNRA
jgi:hypothetical protein